ncbi:hypothetical protein CLOBOL_02149 [Enterocloster bolteae ATCC BAA-613]|uniref:Uncharacterized protein n=1 Tax=Enterocloster bolteae (strain ATCC BAA-613 / DSM 15670 / CCUG 46953 / JCM 12243 / WAL 16351) TaxID=411902 RepID=A8RNA8_ENTBW|nr:hypothetical protein CLOBOL_02149 [Enterocloster bolteae ATCC BAA-613]
MADFAHVSRIHIEPGVILSLSPCSDLLTTICISLNA